MGSFLTNVQVRVGARGVEATRALVLEALRAEARAAGLAETDSDGDRNLVVVHSPDGGWISVLDHEAEAQDGRIAVLAAHLAAAVDDWALSVLVHDSDVLDLRAFHGPRAVDHYVNAPDYFEPVAEEAEHAATLMVLGVARALAPGRGELCAGIYPEGNLNEGAAARGMPVAIVAAGEALPPIQEFLPPGVGR